jgi:uncharacterized protein (DUF2336 family)
MSEASVASLIAEFEQAVSAAPTSRRPAMLRNVTQLFVAAADRLDEDQIALFGEVLTCLIVPGETAALVELATTLSRLSTAPKAVVRRLARHAEVEIAAPVLATSGGLSERELTEIAMSRSPGHLLAIAQRTGLSQAITDILIGRGDGDVWKTVAANSGARFSQNGWAILVSKSKKDAELTQSLALRADVPPTLLEQLLKQTSHAVRVRLLSTAPAESAEKLRSLISTAVGEAEAGAPRPFDLAKAEQVVHQLSRAGRLVDQTVKRFAIDGELANVVAALALLSSVKAEAIVPLLNNALPDGLIVATRASRLDWSTTSMILRNRQPGSSPSEAMLAAGKAAFEALPLSAAQRAIRFWAERDSVKVKYKYGSRETPVQQIRLSKNQELVLI